MSDDEKPTSESGMPDGIPAPPPPKPDVVDPSADQPTYGGSKSAKKKRKKKGRHPSDPYEPLKKKNGCCGCVGGIGVLILVLVVALTAIVCLVGPGRYFAIEGYKTAITFQDPITVITEAPEKATIYMGQKITYNAPLTNVPIAIFGTEVTVNGDFTENVSLTGIKVKGEATARFAKDLEVFAGEYNDEGIFLKGNLTGRVMQSLQ